MRGIKILDKTLHKTCLRFAASAHSEEHKVFFSCFFDAAVYAASSARRCLDFPAGTVLWRVTF